MRSRNSRDSGTVLKCALALGGLVGFTGGSTTAGSSIVASKIVVGRPWQHRFTRPSERGDCKDYQVQFFKIPQLREIKPDRGGVGESALLHFFDEPGYTFIH